MDGLEKQEKNAVEYFQHLEYKDAAIYGLGRLGLCLYEELKSTGMDVKYAIDINAAHFSYLDLKVVSPEGQLEMVDVIVVTPFFEYKKIAEELREITSCRIVSLEDIISSM